MDIQPRRLPSEEAEEELVAPDCQGGEERSRSIDLFKKKKRTRECLAFPFCEHLEGREPPGECGLQTHLLISTESGDKQGSLNRNCHQGLREERTG